MNHELFLIKSSYLTSQILFPPETLPDCKHLEKQYIDYSQPDIPPDCKHLEKQYIECNSKANFDKLIECIQKK
jgi:hypothetical protein